MSIICLYVRLYVYIVCLFVCRYLFVKTRCKLTRLGQFKLSGDDVVSGIPLIGRIAGLPSNDGCARVANDVRREPLLLLARLFVLCRW